MTEHPPTLIGTTALVLIPGDPRVMVGGRRAVLRPQELVLLEILARDPGRLLNTATLAKHLARQGHGKLNKITVAVHVHRLRKRLEPVGLTIRTFRGAGYTLEPTENPGAALRSPGREER
jgi:two-component system, OmpR family, response regulator